MSAIRVAIVVAIAICFRALSGLRDESVTTEIPEVVKTSFLLDPVILNYTFCESCKNLEINSRLEQLKKCVSKAPGYRYIATRVPDDKGRCLKFWFLTWQLYAKRRVRHVAKILRECEKYVEDKGHDYVKCEASTIY